MVLTRAMPRAPTLFLKIECELGAHNLTRQSILGMARASADEYDARTQRAGARGIRGIPGWRRACNDGKRALIVRACTLCAHAPPAELRVLDLACGCGGDLGKWAHAARALRAPCHVIGVDASPASVKEALRRAVQFLPLGLRVTLAQASLAVAAPVWRGTSLAKQAPFDIISCMFALHYLVADRAETTALFSYIAALLRPGGVFICVETRPPAVLRTLPASDAFTLDFPDHAPERVVVTINSDPVLVSDERPVPPADLLAAAAACGFATAQADAQLMCTCAFFGAWAFVKK